jgi:BlaI family transcriptional regulator, penicillinase repressor
MGGMMKESLSKRERQIMERLYIRSAATAEDIRADLGDEVSNSAVRTMLSILETKGLIVHETEGKKFVYRPVVPKNQAGVEAIKSVVRTFFSGSASNAVAAFLHVSGGELSLEDYDRLSALIEAAKKDGD